MSKINRHRAGGNGAPIESLPLWRAAEDRARAGRQPQTAGGRWLARRVPSVSPALADLLAAANGLGVRHDR